MSKEIDQIIKDEVYQDKIFSFLKKNKVAIGLFSFLIFFIPIFYQYFLYKQSKNNEKLLTQYLKADLLRQINEKEAIKILNGLKLSKNETVQILSINELLEYYINNNELSKAILLINKQNYNLELDIFKDLQNIKLVILNFENISENEILKYLQVNNGNSYFKKIKNKLLHDFYIKNNQVTKAKQFLKF